jgi:hypothetical protein
MACRKWPELPEDAKAAKKQFRAFLLAFPSQYHRTQAEQRILQAHRRQKGGGFGDFTGKQAHSLGQTFP